MYKTILKRIFDFAFSISFFILLSPLFVVLTIVLFLVNKGYPFFIQRRPGRNERIFKLIKFRSMTNSRNLNGDLEMDVNRITKFGLFIRKTSLDEIPQLLNVIKGDMSLIGPRPLLVEYLGIYNSFEKRRHEVRPGITGWAQVNGRNTISWSKKFELDVWYIDNISFILDLKILYLTFIKVFKTQDISHDDSPTMPKFERSN